MRQAMQPEARLVSMVAWIFEQEARKAIEVMACFRLVVGWPALSRADKRTIGETLQKLNRKDPENAKAGLAVSPGRFASLTFPLGASRMRP